MKHKLNKKNWI